MKNLFWTHCCLKRFCLLWKIQKHFVDPRVLPINVFWGIFVQFAFQAPLPLPKFCRSSKEDVLVLRTQSFASGIKVPKFFISGKLHFLSLDCPNVWKMGKLNETREREFSKNQIIFAIKWKERKVWQTIFGKLWPPCDGWRQKFIGFLVPRCWESLIS